MIVLMKVLKKTLLTVTAAIVATCATIDFSSASPMEAVYSFPTCPAYLYAGLTVGDDGNFYGTSYNGGKNGLGTFFRVTPAGEITVLASFGGATGYNPKSELIKDGAGDFWGFASAGGTNYNGTIFKATPEGTINAVYSFSYSYAGTNGASPRGLMLAKDGNFYGTTESGGTNSAGTIFRMTPSGDMTFLASLGGEFGNWPHAGLVEGNDGNFYGSAYYGGTNYGGTIFKVTPAGVLTTLHSFDSTTGSSPEAQMILGSDGNFYGTTSYGGTNGNGTIFKMTAAGELTSLVSLEYTTQGSQPTGPLLEGSDGAFYGMARNGGAYSEGTIFKVKAAGEFTLLRSFSYLTGEARIPYGSLVQLGDYLYGTTYYGAFTLLTSFRSPTQNPSALVQAGDGNFYGTVRGDIYSEDYGSIFKLTPAGGLSTIVSFDYFTNGAQSLPGLTEGSDGNLYGTTARGGSYSGGTVFTTSVAGDLTNLFSFLSYSTNGYYPGTQLIQGKDGNFYGSTMSGGPAYSYGTIFKITSAGELATLAAFDSTNGSGPSRLAEGNEGTFYGTTQSGGTYDQGTVFRVTSSGEFTTLVNFDGTNGAAPKAGLTLGSDGNFYGTTFNGSNYYGSVFKMTAAGELTTIASFDWSTGYGPLSELIEADPGHFYGTTSYGGSGYTNYSGTIYKVGSSGGLSVVANCNPDVGTSPTRLIKASDGYLYGAGSGGADGGGVIFRIQPDPVGLPEITSQPTNTFALFGDDVTLSVTVASPSPVTYQWQKYEVDVAGATASSLMLTNVTLFDEGMYRVIVSNVIGSATSSGAFLIVHSPPPPDMPTNLNAVAISSSAITLTWNNNSTNATGIIIWRGDSYETTTQKVATVSASATSFTNTGLAAATLYYYSVQATNIYGVSYKSSPAVAFTFEAPPPVPASLSATAISTNSISLHWLNSGTNVEGFIIWRGVSSGSITQQIGTVSMSTTTFTNTGLAASSVYFYAVQATNHHASSSKSAAASARTFDPPPGTPTGLTATALSSNSVKIVWTKPSGIVSNYYLWRGTNATNVTTLACILPANTPGYTNTGLAAATTYYFSVQAKNGGSSSPKSGIVSVRTLDGPPGAPKNISVRATAPTRAVLSWFKGSTNTSGYIVYRSLNSSSAFAPVTSLSSNVLNYVDNVHSGMTYYYYVKATNTSGSASSMQISTALPVGIGDNFVWQNTNGQFSIWVMSGTNFVRYASLPPGPAASTGWRPAAIGDLNGDFHSDLIWQHRDGRLMVWLLSGTNLTRSFNLKTGYAASTGWRIASAPDLNGDGKVDFLWANTNGQTAAWIMNGTNYSSYVTMRSGGLSTKLGWSVAGATDLTSDANADLVWQNTNGTAAAWIMSRTNYVKSIPLRAGPTPAASWHMALLTDLTYDKKTDFVWQNNNGALQAYLMNETNYVKTVRLKTGSASFTGWQLIGPR